MKLKREKISFNKALLFPERKLFFILEFLKERERGRIKEKEKLGRDKKDLELKFKNFITQT